MPEPSAGRRRGLILALLLVPGCATSSEHVELPPPRPVSSPLATSQPETIQPVAFEARSQPLVPRPDVPFAGPQPVHVYIRHALEENRTVRAARFNVLSLQHRIAQVTSLDDPVVSNTIFPIPAVAPQYSLMGYMPYDALLAQQFPWFGTLKLRGKAAEEDVKVALYELAAAQLDVVAAVKRAYLDLHLSERTRAILVTNRRLAGEFLDIAAERYRTGGATQSDVLRSEIALADIDRELWTLRQGTAEAQAELARLLHVDEAADLATIADPPVQGVPDQLQRLEALACASRPELRGRLAAIARDDRAIDLAQKRYYPNVTLGMVYQDMEKTNAVTPRTASGQPNIGLFVGFNLPIYRKKLAAGVGEARARAAADVQLLEAERDQVRRDVRDLFAQVDSQRHILDILRDVNLPRTRQILETTTNDYRAGSVDYLGLVASWRDVLQVEVQVAQSEVELAKALASLERAVGVQLNDHPPTQSPAPPPSAASPFALPANDRPKPAPPRSVNPLNNP